MRWLTEKHVLYPDLYCWYVLAATLDILMTTIVMTHFDAIEVNLIAAHLIERFGFVGLIPLKFATVVLVVLICEYVGRERHMTGQRVAITAVGLSSLPVVAALAQVGLVMLVL
ncbi:MAG: hypothetical protein KF757_11310 [Phycisphaeraceae bacterium]|nr:hypothetical protein [Phycisphaeraceae bacterium]MCW5762274.1 hypothetical protein [Phycisphaeraceae bacterium]